MRRFLLDTRIAGKFMNRRDGVYERALAEAAKMFSAWTRPSTFVDKGVEFHLAWENKAEK